MADVRRLVSVLMASLLAALTLAAPVAVKAFPAAPTEAETRPCFELLPDPAISRHCWRHWRRGYGYEDGWGYRIVCQYARPGAVSWALEHLPPGARLILVGGARPCRDTLHITRPIEIIGEPGWLNGARVPTLQPLEGRPCIVIEPGRGPVVLKNLLIQSEHGEESCIIQRGRELTLDGTWIRYDGRRSALQVENGRLTARGAVIAARTEQPAVLASGGVEMEATSILATTVGLVVHPTEDSRLRGVNIERLDDWSGSERVTASVGLAFDSAGTGRLNQVEGSKVEGFSRGVYADGGQEVALQNLVIRDSEYGVLSDGSRLRVNGSEIEAVDAGVYAAAGEAWAGNNRIFGVRRAGLFVEKGKARLMARDNLVFADKDGCQALAVEGLDPDAQSCRPWFEAPEFYRTGRVSGRPAFDDVWPDARGSVSTLPGPGF
jgi:hypothetical protein